MTINDPGLIAEFVTESSEHLADIENQLLQIEDAGAEIDVDLVNTVFRGIHSIKGVAGFLGLVTINSLSHRLEDVLNRIRNRELVPTSKTVDAMLKAADALSSMIAVPEESNDVDVAEHLNALDGILAANDALGKGSTVSPAATARDNALVELADEVLDAVSDELAGGSDQPPATSKSEPTKEASLERASSSPKAGVKPSGKPSQPAAETSIRVPVSTLDQLMNLAGEMVLNRNRLLQYAGPAQDADLAAISTGIDHITCELQDAIMQTRMQPIGSAFNRFPRIVRDLSSKLGKQCELVIAGKDVEVDKSIIEAIGDPLTHLVRNSVDHGVERPDKRQASGKPASGTIRLSAYHQAGQVCIDIEDDGGGIDPARLKAKAVAKEVISERQAAEMSQREALRLIFHPGFSTAEKLTDVSGRGVGMDVVRTNIERIGGTVDVESERGKGTTIHIVLPLTLAIIRSLIVGSRSQRFAIPQVNVAELVRVSDKDKDARISRINDAVVVRLRGDLLPLVDLRDALGLHDEEESTVARRRGRFNIVVLESGRSRYGIVVDEMHDSEEIVVKPLGRHLKQCPSLAGATILGDGRVALILDVAGIADKAQLSSIDEDALTACELAPERRDELQKLLLFTNAPHEQFAIPMGLVARIERVAVKEIEEFGGRLVTKYRGGTLPLISVEKFVHAAPRPESHFVSVVVLEGTRSEFGVIAPKIEDIRNIPVHVETATLRENGVVGSQVIEGVTTRILDVFQMLERAYPDAVEKRPVPAQQDEETAPTILLAEDSTFFRTQVAGFLENAGYQVLQAEDGQVAWELLQSERERVDIVVTDIEMPNMNGWEFCQSIRANPDFNDLPVVALTSLAGEEDVRRGKACGIDEYQVKMDRERLLNTIHRLTKAKKPVGIGV